MDYTPYYPGGWQNVPSTSTPITAAALAHIEAGVTTVTGLAPSGDTTGVADTAAIQAVLTPGGLVRLADGTFYVNAPLRIPSNTTLSLSAGTTVTLVANSNCNAVQNWAVGANRRILDGVANGTTTFTSATASFTAADATAPNNKIRIYFTDGTYLDTTIASVTNSTTVVLAAAATESGSGLYAVIGAGRDSNVKVIGGTWVRQTPNNPLSSNAHQIRFRHCDGLEIGPVNGYTADGRYLVNVGDVTNFYVHDILPTSTVSDTVHVNGPASAGTISRVVNPSPGDDVVAFTCGELGAYADVMGNITDVSVDNVVVPAPPAGSPVAVKILAGTSPGSNPYTIDRINVRAVRSMILNDYPVNVCDDPSSGAYTTGGLWGKITLADIANTNPASTYPAVNVIGATITDLEANGLYTVNPANNVLVVESPGSGHGASTIFRLKTDSRPSRVVVNSGSSIRSWYRPTSVSPLTQYAVMYGDGAAIQATAPDASALDMTGAMSLEIWLVPSSLQVGFATPVGKSGQYWLEGDSGGLNKYAMSVQSSGVSHQAIPGSGLQPGRMSYVAGTFVPSTSVNTYYNGALASSNTTSIPATIDTSTNPVYIGNRQGFSRYFAGQIADVRIWSGALTASDIAVHNADPGNLYATSATLLARWKCDEGQGTTLNDSSGNSHNATLSAASWNGPYTPFLVQPQLSTGVSHTVDDVITVLQHLGLVHQ